MFRLPDADIASSRLLGLRFHVSTRTARGRRWERLAEFSDLADTYFLATGLADQHFEVGIFRDGFVYWTSRDPDLFNSTVLRLANSEDSVPHIFVRCYFAHDDPNGAGGTPRVSPAAWAAQTLGRLANVLSVQEHGPYWKMPELDEVTIRLERVGDDAIERACNALAQGGWVHFGDIDAVWNRGPEAHCEDERLVWANVMVLSGGE